MRTSKAAVACSPVEGRDMRLMTAICVGFLIVALTYFIVIGLLHR
jgi:hypothetical protein